jgi:hypothetical protein
MNARKTETFLSPTVTLSLRVQNSDRKVSNKTTPQMNEQQAEAEIERYGKDR